MVLSLLRDMTDQKPISSAEISSRTEWLFWSLFMHLKGDIDDIPTIEDLKIILNIDDAKWPLLREKALFEILVWSLANSVVLMKDKFNENEREEMMQDCVMFLGVFFPSYKDYQIINVLVNYVVLPVRVKEFEAMKDNLEGYLIERLSKTAIASPSVLSQARSQIIDKFRHGWLLALDAFTSVTMVQIEKENQAARVRFHDELLQATERAALGETPAEKIEREKWEKSADELTSLAKQALGEVSAEIERRENTKNLEELQQIDLQAMLTKAWNLKLEGRMEEALKIYSKAFDVLNKEAMDYARSSKSAVQDEGNTRKLLPKYFEKAKEYHKRNDASCKISNNMGVIFAEIGDIEAARRMFEQAIEFTPDGMDYPEPKIGLRELDKKRLNMVKNDSHKPQLTSTEFGDFLYKAARETEKRFVSEVLSKPSVKIEGAETNFESKKFDPLEVTILHLWIAAKAIGSRYQDSLDKMIYEFINEHSSSEGLLKRINDRFAEYYQAFDFHDWPLLGRKAYSNVFQRAELKDDSFFYGDKSEASDPKKPMMVVDVFEMMEFGSFAHWILTFIKTFKNYLDKVEILSH